MPEKIGCEARRAIKMDVDNKQITLAYGQGRNGLRNFTAASGQLGLFSEDIECLTLIPIAVDIQLGHQETYQKFETTRSEPSQNLKASSRLIVGTGQVKQVGAQHRGYQSTPRFHAWINYPP